MDKQKIRRIIVNDGQYTFESLEKEALDVVQSGQDVFHILCDHKNFKAHLIKADLQARLFTINVNGCIYEVKLEDQYDELVKKMGLTTNNSSRIKDIKAPMPGLVLDVLVAAGDPIQKGDPLLILEAMKMENVIKAPGDGVVKAVHIQKGKAVEKGELLVEME